jgi:hypothetical protein
MGACESASSEVATPGKVSPFLEGKQTKRDKHKFSNPTPPPGKLEMSSLNGNQHEMQAKSLTSSPKANRTQ